jgi:hypothetical protein
VNGALMDTKFPRPRALDPVTLVPRVISLLGASIASSVRKVSLQAEQAR